MNNQNTPANSAAAAAAAAQAAALAAARDQANRDRAAQRALDTAKNTRLRAYLFQHHPAILAAADVGLGDNKGKTEEAALHALQDLAAQLAAKDQEIAALKTEVAAPVKLEPGVKLEEEE